MKEGFGKHFAADLYLCQNELWRTPKQFTAEVRKVAQSAGIPDIDWVFQLETPALIRIMGEAIELFVLMQVFNEKAFIALDIFYWRPFALGTQDFNENLLEVFSPQVVAIETRLRAEHLN